MRLEAFADSDLSVDAMLGGLVQVHQPVQGYRAGTDPVLLAASIPAHAGQSVLELGCGAAPGLCCLGVRVPGLRLRGIELQPGYADLARRNLTSNGLDGDIWQGDLSDPPAQMKAESFDHVIANPPYFEAGKRIVAEDGGREIALAGETPLTSWVEIGAKRLKPRGYLTIIQRAERLPELMTAMQTHLGAIELLPLVPRVGRPPRLILIRARKDGRTPFRFHAPLILHDGENHGDSETYYSPRVEKVMRDGAALDFPA